MVIIYGWRGVGSVTEWGGQRIEFAEIEGGACNKRGKYNSVFDFRKRADLPPPVNFDCSVIASLRPSCYTNYHCPSKKIKRETHWHRIKMEYKFQDIQEICLIDSVFLIEGKKTCITSTKHKTILFLWDLWQENVWELILSDISKSNSPQKTGSASSVNCIPNPKLCLVKGNL